MNSYNPNGSEKVVVILLMVSVSLAGLIHAGLDAANLDLQWLISVPSVAIIYGILYYAFEHHVWKWRWLRKLKLVTVPNLNGRWDGQIKSSYASNGQDHQISVTITQQWSKILVRLEAKESNSKSIAASFLMDDPSSPELVYVYDNEPGTWAPESMHIHGGTARLRLTGSVLQGKYYTGQERRTVGEIKLKKA
ncbi:MAG: hypothetical protein IS632_08830 [Thaumarchaeota archaeon]|nr:hypothetical protein [Nitrososphaerota archaeon]